MARSEEPALHIDQGRDHLFYYRQSDPDLNHRPNSKQNCINYLSRKECGIYEAFAEKRSEGQVF
jgi:hypothetical protein